MPCEPKSGIDASDLEELTEAADVQDDEVKIAADDAGASAAMEKLAKIEQNRTKRWPHSPW